MSSVPVTIQCPRAEQPQLQHTPHTTVYGTSPSSGRQDKHPSGSQAARKLLRRIQWDSSLDENEWTVGVLETREQAERKSGAEAWSLRVQTTVVELSFTEFVAKYDKEGEEVPFHRIAWFKQNGLLAWEAEHLRHKLAYMNDQHHAHAGSTVGLSASPALGSHLLGCSPPTGSFMARLAAAAGNAGPPGAGPASSAAISGSSFTGLPPRCSNSPSDAPLGAAGNSLHATPQQQHWRPHRLSGTDMGSSSGGSWCAGPAPVRDVASPWPGPGCTHVGFASGLTGAHAAAGANTSSHTGHMTPSPLLGGSPNCSSSTAAAHSGGQSSGTPLGTSPRLMSTSWGAAGDGNSRSSSAGGVLGQGVSSRGLAPEHSAHSFMSASPAGSCSSSWTGTSPLAAAAASGFSSLPMPAALRGLSAVSTGVGGSSWPGLPGLPAGGLSAALASAGSDTTAALLQLEQPLQPQPFVEPELADYSQLPEKCWMDILQRLAVRELCCAARVNTTLRGLTAHASLWGAAYTRLFGMPAPADWSGPTVKRLCRRSELRASRWLEADVEARAVGFSGTWCCQLDESKVVSGDGCAVRLWAHESGRRIATLRGHSGRVMSVAFDDERILSGCSQGIVKLWSMDELKLSKTLRHHSAPVSATLLLHGLPISGSQDGCVCLWDANAPNTPMVVLEAGGPVHALQLLEDRGYLVTGSNSLGVWDVETTQLLFTLDAPAGPAASLSGSSSSGSLAAAAAAASAAPADAGGDGDGDEDDVLLQNGWLMQDEDSDSSLSDDEDEFGDQQQPQGQQQQPAAAAAAAAVGGSAHVGSRPWTAISCHGNVLAAGRAGGVVLWDVRTQEAVGAIQAPAAGPGRAASSSSPCRWHLSSAAGPSCVGVQLDDWRLVTGFTGAGSSAGGRPGSAGAGSSSGSGACWWQSGGEAWGEEGVGPGRASGHSLGVYDIRAAASFSSAAGAGDSRDAAGSSSSSGGSGCGLGRLWSAPPVMSLPVQRRVTCFQFHGQHLLVGQEGAECCLLSFHPPGSRSGHAAAAWGYAGASSSRGSCGYATANTASATAAGASPGGLYMASPRAGGVMADEGGHSSGKKGKKGGTRVPPKKQTRYPKRTTR